MPFPPRSSTSTLSRPKLERFRIHCSRPEFDDVVVKSIADFLPFRNEVIEIFAAITLYHCPSGMVDALHRLFEKLKPYMNRPEHIMQWNETDFDNYYLIVHELLLYCHAVLLTRQRFDAAALLIDTEYFFDDPFTMVSMHSYVEFRKYMKSLERRNQRLNLTASCTAGRLAQGTQPRYRHRL